MCFGLENLLVAYDDDATLIAVVPSPNMRCAVAQSLNRDLARIGAWCGTCGMKMNPPEDTDYGGESVSDSGSPSP